MMNPGVYKVNKGSWTEDGLIAAGGLGVNADRDWVEKNLNRAEMITDGMKIYIPKKNNQILVSNDQNEEVITTDSKTGTVLRSQTKVVSINTATAEELDSLPGIGDKLYAKIENLVEL